MELKFRCPSCGNKLSTEENMAGMTVNCPGCDTPVRVPRPSLAPGKELGGFRIDHLLGTGAMGEVFLATQLSMDRPVALKVLSSELLEDEESVNFFQNEVRSLARLDHPNIVAAFEAGCLEDRHYLAMTYVDGESLLETVEREGPLDEHDALRHCLKVARALEYAWTRFQMLHRDVKPANIMIDSNGEVKLMDLGLAKHTSGDEVGSESYAYGTPDYMSPEQIRAQSNIDCRSDIYSLGATLYHLIVGEPPYGEGEPASIIRQHLMEPIPSAREVDPDLSEETDTLIQCMMQKDPNLRFRSWADVINEIRRCLKNLDTERASSASTGKRGKKMVLHNVPTPATTQLPPRQGAGIGTWLLVGFFVLGVFGAIGFLGWTVYQDSKDYLVDPNNGTDSGTDTMAALPPVPPDEEDTDAESPTDPIADPMQDEESEYRAMVRKRLEDARQFVVDSPEDFQGQIDAYRHVADLAPSSDEANEARDAIARIEAERTDAITQVMQQLETDAKPAIDNENFNRAAAIYRNYDGPHAAITRADRMRLVKLYQGRARAIADEKAAAKQAADAKLTTTLDQLATFLWGQRFESVRQVVDTARKDPELELVAKEMEPSLQAAQIAADYPQRVVASFAKQADAGETVTLRLKSKKLPVRLEHASLAQGIRGRQQVQIGNSVGWVGFTCRWGELDHREFLDRQTTDAEPGNSLARFLILLAADEKTSAKAVLDSQEGPLADALKRKWDEFYNVPPADIDQPFDDDLLAGSDDDDDDDGAMSVPTDDLVTWLHGRNGIQLDRYGRVEGWENRADGGTAARQWRASSRPNQADPQQYDGRGGIEVREAKQALTMDNEPLHDQRQATLFILFTTDARARLDANYRVFGLESVKQNDEHHFFRIDFWGILPADTGKPTVTIGVGGGRTVSATGPNVQPRGRNPVLLVVRAQPGEIVVRQNGVSGTPVTSPWADDGRIDAKGQYAVGASSLNGRPVGDFTGAVHELIIYDRALSDAEIRDLESQIIRTYGLRF